MSCIVGTMTSSCAFRPPMALGLTTVAHFLGPFLSMGNIIAFYVFNTLTERSCNLPANSTNLLATPKPPRGGGGLLTLSEISSRPSYSEVPGYIKTYLLRYYCQHFVLVFSLRSQSRRTPHLAWILRLEDRFFKSIIPHSGTNISRISSFMCLQITWDSKLRAFLPRAAISVILRRMLLLVICPAEGPT
jgi:hypothetical protein